MHSALEISAGGSTAEPLLRDAGSWCACRPIGIKGGRRAPIKLVGRNRIMNSLVGRIALHFFAALLVFSALQLPAYAKPFVLEEATVDSIPAAFANNTLTCTARVKGYLARIEAYDKKGPALRSIITVNTEALSAEANVHKQYKAE